MKLVLATLTALMLTVANTQAGPTISFGPVVVHLHPRAFSETCIASRYSGGKTASGERTSSSSNTAAHRSLPFGTVVRVTNLRNGASTEARIVDRGPYVRGRCIDVTSKVARRLGFSGLTRVRVAVVK